MADTLPDVISWVFVLTTLTCTGIYLAAMHATSRRVGLAAAVLLMLLAVHGWLAADGFYLVKTVPPRFPLAPLPSTVILLALFFIRGGPVPPLAAMRLLVLLSVVRIPVELVLLALSRNGAIPALMTFEGRNFDILSGVSAPFVAWLAFRGGRINRPLLVVWHVAALALLINIVTIAILSLETPFQRLAFDQPNRGVLYFPFIWLPAVVVPIVFVSHVVSLWALTRFGSRTYVAAAAAALLLIPVTTSAQDPRGQLPRSESSATRVISPAVVVTWLTERAPADGRDHLHLLVLWRGSPGWFAAPGGVRGSTDSTGEHRIAITYGDVQLRLSYSALQHRVVINNTPVDTGTANVVFVDDVDGRRGARVVQTLQIESAMPGTAQQIGLVLRTSPAMMAFLRCDATSKDPSKARAITGNSCLQNVGAVP